MAASGDQKKIRMITLKSSDGEIFEVEEAVALVSQTIKHLVEDDCADNAIPIPNVNSQILAKVFAVLQEASCDGKNEETLKNWKADFVKIGRSELFDLVLAANYLNIKGLLDLTCQTIADSIMDKSPVEEFSLCELD